MDQKNKWPCTVPVGRHVDGNAQVNQSHAANHNRELAEAYAPAYSTILFRYHALLVFSSHFFTFYNFFSIFLIDILSLHVYKYNAEYFIIISHTLSQVHAIQQFFFLFTLH